MREFGPEFRFNTHTPEDPPVPPEQNREHILRFDNPVTEHVRNLQKTNPEIAATIESTLRTQTVEFQSRETSLLADLSKVLSRFKKKVLTTLATASVVWSAGACRTEYRGESIPVAPASTDNDREAGNVGVSEIKTPTHPQLRADVGDIVVDGVYKIGEVIKEQNIEFSREPGGIEPRGFEHSILVSNEYVKEAYDILPRSLQLHVHDVEYKDEAGVVPESYGLVDKAVVIAHNNRVSGTITFFKDCNHKTPDELLAGTLIHEAAHGADWLTNKFLTTEERIQFLQAVVNRVKSADRFRSGYVESINNENKQTELFKKVAEYWAEIVEEYHKYEHGTLAQMDIDLVTYWLKKTDPSSDPETDSARVEQKMFELTQKVEASLEKKGKGASNDVDDDMREARIGEEKITD